MIYYLPPGVINQITAAPKKFTLLTGAGGRSLVVGKPSDILLKTIEGKIGESKSLTKGTCHKDDMGTCVFALKDATKENDVDKILKDHVHKYSFEPLAEGALEKLETAPTQGTPLNSPVMPRTFPPTPQVRQPAAQGQTATPQVRQPAAQGQTATPPQTPPPSTKPPVLPRPVPRVAPTGQTIPAPTQTGPGVSQPMPNRPPPLRPQGQQPPPVQPPPDRPVLRRQDANANLAGNAPTGTPPVNQTSPPIQQGQQPPTGTPPPNRPPPPSPTTKPPVQPRPVPRSAQAQAQQTPQVSPIAVKSVRKRVIPPVPPLPPGVDVDVAATFSPEYLKQVKKDTTRFIGGTGEFGAVLDGAAAAAEQAQKLKQLSSGGAVNAMAINEQRTTAIAEYRKLLGTLDGYTLKSRGEDETSGIRLKKEAFYNEAKTLATKAIAKIGLEQRAEMLKYLTDKNAAGGLTAKEESLFHEKRAESLLASGQGTEKPEGGTSDVKLIPGANGKPAYAFKNISGESDQMQAMGVPPGGGTAQEILTSKLSDVLEDVCGFKSGFPKTTLATLPVTAGGDRASNVGALIEGLAGRDLDVDSGGAYFKFEKMSKEEREQIYQRCRDLDAQDPNLNLYEKDSAYANLRKHDARETARNLPPREVQKLLFMNLASGNADSKWESVMVDGQNARPFDGGGAMLSEKVMLAMGRDFDNDINPSFGKRMLIVPYGHHDNPEKLPVASAPMEKEFTDQILGIDLNRVRAEMTAEVKRLQGEDPLLATAVSDSNVTTCLKSIECMQKAVRANPTATTEQFLDAYNAEMKTWLEEVAARG